jgi:hypothetical protein
MGPWDIIDPCVLEGVIVLTGQDFVDGGQWMDVRRGRQTAQSASRNSRIVSRRPVSWYFGHFDLCLNPVNGGGAGPFITAKCGQFPPHATGVCVTVPTDLVVLLFGGLFGPHHHIYRPRKTQEIGYSENKTGKA